VRILWDEPKRRTSLGRHRLDFADLSAEFFAAAVVRPVRQGRLQAIGLLADRLVAVVFLPMGSEAISVISMRRASRKERMVYESQDPTAHR
jgi:uncharacterized DUF497 family protein